MKHRPILSAIILCALMLAAPFSGVAAEGPSIPLSPEDLEAIASKRVVKFDPALYEMEDLESMGEQINAGSPVTLTGLGRSYTLDLMVDPIFSAEALASQPLVQPYRGSIRGEEGSSVRLTLDLERGALNAMLRFADGQILNVEPVHEAGGPLHMWYDNDDAIVTLPPESSEPGTGEPAPAATGPGPVLPDTAAVPEAPGNQTGSGIGVMVLAGQNTYTSVRLRVYYDTGTNPSSIIQRMDDTWSSEMLITFEVISISAVNTDTWEDNECGQGTFDLMDRFVTNVPLTGTEPNRNDRAFLFTNNANINYGTGLGCGLRPGTHAWARWTGSDKQKAIVGDQEIGHNFNAQHDDTTRIDHCHFFFGFCWNNHQHWTIMHGTYEGDDNMDETFSAASQGVIEPYADTNMPRKTKIWTGSDVSGANVKLTWWEVRYPKAPTGGSVLELKRTWSANSGTVSLSSAFVGARNGADANRDFGYLGAQTLTTSPTTNEWTYTLPASQTGTWHFWPAYDSCGSGCWGPYKWQEIQLSVT